MKFENKAMLITYADSLGKDLKDLKYVLDTYFKGAISGVHILPFFPSSADRGFAPMTYREVEKDFGNWEDINNIAKDYYLMYDYMINHISASSKYFKDFKENKDKSEYKDLFIRYNKFWNSEEEQKNNLEKVYKRKPRDPFIEVEFKDGTKEKLWCTFDEEQVDLNVKSETTKKFTKENLMFLANNGASIIRLDAFAYATKKKGTNCFFVEPDVYNILDECKEILEKNNVEILPEIHEHYTIQLKLVEKGYWVYDFVLPMLLLYTLYSGKNERLINWLKICPRKQFTTLDTHDGIGVVDVKDILTDEEIEFTKEYLFDNGANIKRIYNTMAYNNLDIYQINCTYYSALGNNDKSYLLSRAIQMFTPGIPQIYYVGLLAGKNDIELLEETKVGRNINRHYYTLDEIKEETEREVVKKLLNLLKFRNTYDAFNGNIKINENVESNILDIRWEKDGNFANLKADLKTYDFKIYYYDINNKEIKELII
ncbi:sucrose phosphorylase [[Clostridium] colinum]|uniref:sucrose phosphorylase n=1 Tax=[Clostridium] colinum TaxID=36835 RepID=UPI002024EC41|nr:sucrose phosphorylase [[Clostridium] colinum]